MSEIDKIKSSADTVMTAELVRLFAFAGCKPTACHACGKKIKVGDTFKLVPHAREPFTLDFHDEMCCDKCGERQLVNRDRRERRTKMKLRGGYSRPSQIPAAVIRFAGGNEQ